MPYDQEGILSEVPGRSSYFPNISARIHLPSEIERMKCAPIHGAATSGRWKTAATIG
jgi:hypothetical protein